MSGWLGFSSMLLSILISISSNIFSFPGCQGGHTKQDKANILALRRIYVPGFSRPRLVGMTVLALAFLISSGCRLGQPGLYSFWLCLCWYAASGAKVLRQRRGFPCGILRRDRLPQFFPQILWCGPRQRACRSACRESQGSGLCRCAHLPQGPRLWRY